MLLEERQAAEIEVLREKVRQLELMLAPPGYVVPIEWRLTVHEARIFCYLLTRPMATKDQLMAALYSDRVDEAPEIKIVDVFVCKLRKKIAPFGVKIATHWGQGYGLPDRELILQAVA